jgi:hypothetical protein
MSVLLTRRLPRARGFAATLWFASAQAGFAGLALRPCRAW